MTTTRVLYGGTFHNINLQHIKDTLNLCSRLGFNRNIIINKKGDIETFKAQQTATGTNSMKQAVDYGRSLNPPIEQMISLDFYSMVPVFPANPLESDGNNNLFNPNYITNRPGTFQGVFLDSAEFYQTRYIEYATWLLNNTNSNYYEVEEAVMCCLKVGGVDTPDPNRIIPLTAFLKRIATALKIIKPSVKVGINVPSNHLVGMQSEGIDPETLAGKPTQYNNYTASEPILDFLNVQSAVQEPIGFIQSHEYWRNLLSPLEVDAVDYIVAGETLGSYGCVNRPGDPNNPNRPWVKACFSQHYFGCLKALVAGNYNFGVFSTQLLLDNYPIALFDDYNAPPETTNVQDATETIINSYNCPKPQFIFNINQV